jgi:transcriptional regulator with XRE-family HTH domain
VADEAARQRQALGRALKDARVAARMTQQQAAAALGCGQPKIAKMENRLVLVNARDLSKLLAVYEVSEAEATRINELAERVTPGTSASAASNQSYLQMLAVESDADEILSLHSEGIPSLLQSEYYMITQYESARNTTDKAVLIANQQSRREIFGADSRLRRYRAILAESALHRMPGGRTAALVIDQAQHLLKLGETYDRLEIRIATYSARIPYFPADLTVLKFGGRTKDMAYLESGSGSGRRFDGVGIVSEHEDCWHMVNDAALDLDDSRKFLNDLVATARAW